MNLPENPQVDVLIPAYNPKPEHLREALDSLLAQTFQNWKALIHDDASETDVASIVEPYLTDSRITFEKSEDNLGIGGNWNVCFKKTSLPVVAFLFQDDIWSIHYLEKSVQILNDHPSVGLVSMNHNYKLEEGVDTPEDYEVLQVIKKQRLSPGFHEGRKYLNKWIEDGLWPNLIGEPDFVVMRREAMERAGLFKETMPQLLDAEYWVRMLLKTDLYYHNKQSGSFRVHPTAASAQNRERGKALFDRFKTLDDLIKTMPRGAERKVALKAQIKQFEMMAEKYRKKRDRGDTIKYYGIGCIKGFCMRHPIVTLRTVAQALKRDS
ncbi:glycosyltransferase [Patescibacteria group bacterium]|nr:glycosyltransferase [Patescibacteria group bacterium]MBU2259229.1 glycosyltransferase [Patescibacteria group bacterium]